jgi:hypothetical protein
MKDASDLVDAITMAVAGKHNLAESITAYEDEMRPRGANEVALSYEQAKKTKNLATVRDSPVFRHGHSRV